FGESDEGWKARLRIPAGPPKNTEPPVDYAATQGKGFRDFIEPPPRRSAPKPAAPVERPAPAGLPPDITPGEIAALTAAAAQFKGGTPAGPAQPAALTERATEATVESAADAPETQTRSAESSTEENAPVTFASAPEMEVSPARELATESTPETA